ncbi:MFS transporter [Anaeropeptidivorans aminofermentans]|uniref:MFS transporter n=1 Tax=Anaeropeptidivorans aminofermentans TaxID=2934315 RepID=UPI002023D1B4|nr:MFS transporter [Anaeropeptidivorans aminofermentans]MBE6011154.1 MFS transporter [Lachnospiraceae bacterium]
MELLVNDPTVQKKRWYLLIIVGIVTAMSSFALNAINIALPNIVSDYGITGLDVAWVQTAFILTSTCLVVFLGRTGDSYGKIRQFKISILILTIGLFLGGIKGSFELLIFSRVLQGIGSALSMSVNFAIATEIFPEHERGKALGIVGAFLSGGGIFGPVFSGMVLERWGYHIIFWFGVPVGIIAAIMAYTMMPKDRILSGKKVDYIGFVLLAAMIICFFFGVDAAKSQGFLGTKSLLLIAGFVISLVLFISYEKKADNPLIKLSIIKNRSMAIYLLSLFLIYTTSAFHSYMMPFYLRQALAIPAAQASLMTVVISISITVVSPYAGKFSDKYGAKNMILIGATLIAVSQLAYVFFGLGTSSALLIATFILTGIGSGVFQTPNNAMIMSQVPKEQLGLASGMAVLTRNLALTSGSLFASRILFSAMSSISGQTVESYLPDNPELFISGMHVVYFVTFVFCAAAFVMVLIDKMKSKDTENTAQKAK